MGTVQNIDNAKFRELLGDRSAGLSEDEVDAIRRNLYTLAEGFVDLIQNSPVSFKMTDSEGNERAVIGDLLSEDSELAEDQFCEIDPIFPLELEPSEYELFDEETGEAAPRSQETINKLMQITGDTIQ